MLLLVATVTPFTARGALDRPAVRRHARWLLSRGVDRVCPGGTTGELVFLSWQERVALLEECTGAVGAACMPCTWHPTTHGPARLARRAELAGAGAVFLPPPVAHPVPPSVVQDWYARVRDATTLPVYAYHHPGLGNPLSEELVASLLGEGGLSGVKDSSGDPARLARLTGASPGRVIVGRERLASQVGQLLAAGFISRAANAWPGLVRAVLRGDADAAHALERLEHTLARAGPVAATRAALGLRGRFPLDRVHGDACAALPAPEAGWELPAPR